MRTMPSSEKEGRRLILAGYSDEFVQMANDCSTWLFWHYRLRASQHVIVGNGSLFFLDAGVGPFGVTASHVIHALLKAKEDHRELGIQMGNISLDPSLLLLGDDPILDVATFRINERDIASIGKRPHIDPKQWPPPRKRIEGSSSAGIEGHTTRTSHRTSQSPGNSGMGSGLLLACSIAE